MMRLVIKQGAGKSACVTVAAAAGTQVSAFHTTTPTHFSRRGGNAANSAQKRSVGPVAHPVEVFRSMQLGMMPTPLVAKRFMEMFFSEELAKRRVTSLKLHAMESGACNELLRTLFYEKFLSVPVRLITVDIEFTGSPNFTAEGPSEDITEIAAYCPVRGKVFSRLVQTDKFISPAVEKLTGISNELIAKEGVPFAEAWEDMLRFIDGDMEPEPPREEVIAMQLQRDKERADRGEKNEVVVLGKQGAFPPPPPADFNPNKPHPPTKVYDGLVLLDKQLVSLNDYLKSPAGAKLEPYVKRLRLTQDAEADKALREAAKGKGEEVKGKPVRAPPKVPLPLATATINQDAEDLLVWYDAIDERRLPTTLGPSEDPKTGRKQRVLLLSHGARSADVTMLEWALKRNNLTFPEHYRFADTLNIIQDMHRRRPVTQDKHPPSFSLEGVISWLKLPINAEAAAHRAGPDAALTWMALFHTLDRYGDETLTPHQQLVLRYFENEAVNLMYSSEGSTATERENTFIAADPDAHSSAAYDNSDGGDDVLDFDLDSVMKK